MIKRPLAFLCTTLHCILSRTFYHVYQYYLRCYSLTCEEYFMKVFGYVFHLSYRLMIDTKKYLFPQFYLLFKFFFSFYVITICIPITGSLIGWEKCLQFRSRVTKHLFWNHKQFPSDGRNRQDLRVPSGKSVFYSFTYFLFFILRAHEQSKTQTNITNIIKQTF